MCRGNIDQEFAPAFHPPCAGQNVENGDIVSEYGQRPRLELLHKIQVLWIYYRRPSEKSSFVIARNERHTEVQQMPIGAI